MTMLRLPIFTALTLCLSLPGCDSDNEEVTATASESGGASATGDIATSSGGTTDATASGSTTASGTTDDTATTVEPTGTTTGGSQSTQGESSETGPLESCSAATGESSCLDTPQCQWFPSSTVAPEVANGCEDLGLDDGVCLEVDRDNRECTPNHLTTCEAGAVYYREAGLEIGAIELLVFNDESLCDFPDDFVPCQVNAEPKPGSEPSFFPPACACACE